MGIMEQADTKGWTLQNDRLAVHIAAPGTVYRGSRFDWTGTVTQVTLDRRHTFCTKESLGEGEGTGGIGLMNEFGILQPIGYEEAAVGGTFPKLGVGLLTRLDEKDYSFARPYQVEPFHTDAVARETEVTFTCRPGGTNGYAVRLVKKVSLDKSGLVFAYELSNVGRKPVATVEYGHNFVAVDGLPIGPGYRLRLPNTFASPSPSDAASPLRYNSGELRWQSVPAKPFYCRSAGPFAPGTQWELVHDNGAGLRETVDFAPAFMAVWGMGHVVSPEVFLEFVLPPNGTLNWTRRIDFFSGLE